ncbi:MAG: serine hydrolase domain-containing protein, partial [Bacteroides sp.]
DLGFRAAKLNEIDSIVLQAIEEGAFTGSQVALLKDGELAFLKSYGSFSGRNSQAVSHSDFFDLASLTKTTATLLAVMKLYDQGKLNLTDKISTFLPELQGTDKKNISIQELLFHESGMSAGLYIYGEIVDENSYKGALFKARKDATHTLQLGRNSWINPNFKLINGLSSNVKTNRHSLQLADSLWFDPLIKEQILAAIKDKKLLSKKYRYSCLGFILLQQVVEKITQQPLDKYVEESFYKPMGLALTYTPLRYMDKSQIVPSNRDQVFRKTDLQGFVHDETAALLGGVSGNAGLFGNAQEVAQVYQMLLNGGVYKGQRYLGESTCKLFTSKQSKLSRRGLGFDRPNPIAAQYSPCSESTPKEVFGHTGFTGTCAWADPVHNLVYVFLSNRTYPSVWPNKLGELNVREEIQEVIYQALQ